METQKVYNTDLFGIDEDYELEINETKHIYIEDLYFELWKELTWDIDIIVNGVCCKEDRVELTQEEWNFAKYILSSASDLLTPKQLLALYCFSGNEAQSNSYPDKRWQLISEEMAKSQKLQEFDIVDFQDYCRKIYKIKPLVFLKLTDILYESQVIRPLCIKQNNALEGFERYMNSLTWQST